MARTIIVVVSRLGNFASKKPLHVYVSSISFEKDGIRCEFCQDCGVGDEATTMDETERLVSRE